MTLTTSLFPRIYLASQSPRRRELLTQIGVEFDVLSIDIEEQQRANESPQNYVCRLSQEKAQAGALSSNDRPVLGADTIVVLDERVLEKPRDQGHGVEMLLRLSGQSHQVMTAVSVIDKAQCQTCLSCTRVRFRPISESEAIAYYQTGEPCDKAGGYGIQGLGAIFVESIEGSYSGVMGLPLFETANVLASSGDNNS